jgi:hypothetical protein
MAAQAAIHASRHIFYDRLELRECGNRPTPTLTKSN